MKMPFGFCRDFATVRRLLLLALLVAAPLVALLGIAGPARAGDATDSEIREQRIVGSLEYLASDQLEGRGVGTEGLNLAAKYLAEQFAEMGLVTDSYGGQPFQNFSMQTGAKLGPKNHATFIGPPGKDGKPLQIELKLGEDYTPLSIGGSGTLDVPLVFAGYGITGKDEKYDDYGDVDVEGKAVVVMRHEPQQDNPHSAFSGARNSPHAPFARKLSNAYEHGAAAVIFCTDFYDVQKLVEQQRKRWQQAVNELVAAGQGFKEAENPTQEQFETHRLEIEKLAQAVVNQGERLKDQYDPLLRFDGAGGRIGGNRLPVLFCRRSVLDRLLELAADADLATLEKQIDKGPTPQSRQLQGWRLEGQVSVEHTEAEVKNVVAVLEGEGPRAEETIIVGAHYDHLGRGGAGSLAPNSSDIHNGADDNGSGTAALIEVARLLAGRQKKLPRRVVFIAFTGEERGLVGSARYCSNPLVPLEQTVAMLNMDMVGRLRDDKLIIQGVDTAKVFGEIIDELNKRYEFKITRKPGGFGPSDHSSFYSKAVPVLHFFTGTHPDYHRPSDDFDKINVVGMRRIAEMVAEMTVILAEAERRPEYVATKPPTAGSGGDRPYFGSIPDFAQEGPGYAISGVAAESPAAKGKLLGGDTIIQLGESRIGSLEDFDNALRKYKGGDKITVVVRRDGKEVELEVTLEPPR